MRVRTSRGKSSRLSGYNSSCIVLWWWWSICGVLMRGEVPCHSLGVHSTNTGPFISAVCPDRCSINLKCNYGEGRPKGKRNRKFIE